MGDTKQLVHVTKNRPRPARGRRPPTRAPGGQQNSVVGPEIVVDNFDDGIDSFFSKPAVRPQSAAYVFCYFLNVLLDVAECCHVEYTPKNQVSS